MSSKIKCFISASADTDTSLVLEILQKLNVETSDIYDLPLGSHIQTELKRKIEEADFVIAVITDSNPNVIYEVGVSEGMGKSLVVIVDENGELPSFLRNQLYLRTSLKDNGLLEISLSTIIGEMRLNRDYLRRKSRTSSTISLDNKELEQYIGKIASIREKGMGVEFEALAEKLFRQIGYTSIRSELPVKDRGIDLAVSDKKTGSIILVEAKCGSLDRRRLQHAEMQLQESIRKVKANAGLLIYLDRDGRKFPGDYALNPLVLRFDFEDLVRELAKNSLEDTIRRKRNNMVHGVNE